MTDQALDATEQVDVTPPPADVADATPPPAVTEAPEATEVREPAPETHGNAGKQPWFMKTIQEKDDLIAQQQRELQATREMMERLQHTDPKAPAPPQQTTQPPTNDQERIRAEAARMMFLENVAALRDRGVQQFGSGFNDAIAVLNATGAATDDFVADVLAVNKDSAHVLLEALSKDPERARSLASMNSRQRIAELTRMSMAPPSDKTTDPKGNAAAAPAAARNVSRAPAPPPAINPGAKKTVDWRADEASDEEFTRGFDEMMERRAKAGRR